MNIRADIEKKVAEALRVLGVSEPIVRIEHPAELSHGDYATGAALQCAKQLGMSPRALAEKIVAEIGAVEGVSNIDIAGPGFINFVLSGTTLAASITAAHGDDTWGRNVVRRDMIMAIEYTSPNLFKPLHIGNLVGNVFGESFARLYEYSGALVHRINYPSDIGLTVAKGVWGLKRSNGDPNDIRALGEAYRLGNEAYETDEKAKIEINAINKALYENSDEELSGLRRRGIETSKRHLDELCRKLGTTFDKEIFESEAGPIGKEIVRAHLSDGIFEESEGAIVYKGEKHGLHTRVFINSAGLPTYEAKDLGNFSLKLRAYPDFTHAVVVTGSEQREYFAVMKQAFWDVFQKEMETKQFFHVATGFLTLTTGKMSSRKGNVLTGEDLIADLMESAKTRAAESRAEDKVKLAEEIAVAALKYDILKQSSGKNIVFDRERALSLDGDSGPYLQYTHARTNAIVSKAENDGIDFRPNENAEPDVVARLVHRFPEIVELAARDGEPHIVVTYLVSLASCFNSWYAKEQILDGTSAAAHKVALTDAVRKTLKNGLWILGIPAPEKM